jgi:hypothetical protein
MAGVKEILKAENFGIAQRERVLERLLEDITLVHKHPGHPCVASNGTGRGASSLPTRDLVQ